MGLSPDTHVYQEPRTRSILCVQPDREMRAVLQQALSSYSLVLVSTGLEAIRHYAPHLDRADWRYGPGDTARYTISLTRGGRLAPSRATAG